MMSKYQSIKAIGFAAVATLVIVGILAVFAAVTSNVVMLFTAGSGVICAFTSICAVDSTLAEHSRIYRRVAR